MNDMTSVELGIKTDSFGFSRSREPGTGGLEEVGVRVDSKGNLRRTHGPKFTTLPEDRVAHYTEIIHQNMYFDPTWVAGLGLVDNIVGAPGMGIPNTRLSIILASAFQAGISPDNAARIQRSVDLIPVNNQADQTKRNIAERILYGAIIPAIELSQIQNIGRFASLHEYLQQHPQVEPSAVGLLLAMDESTRRSFGYFMTLAGREVAPDGTFRYDNFHCNRADGTALQFNDLDPRAARKEFCPKEDPPGSGHIVFDKSGSPIMERRTIRRDPREDNVTRDAYIGEVARRVGCSLGPAVVAYELFRLFQPHMHAGWSTINEWANEEVNRVPGVRLSGVDLSREVSPLVDNPFTTIAKRDSTVRHPISGVVTYKGLDDILNDAMRERGIAGVGGFSDTLTHLMQNAFMRRHEQLSLVYSALDEMRDKRSGTGSFVDIPFGSRPKSIRETLNKAGDKSALDKDKIDRLSMSQHISDKIPAREGFVESNKASIRYGMARDKRTYVDPVVNTVKAIGKLFHR